MNFRLLNPAPRTLRQHQMFLLAVCRNSRRSWSRKLLRWKRVIRIVLKQRPKINSATRSPSIPTSTGRQLLAMLFSKVGRGIRRIHGRQQFRDCDGVRVVGSPEQLHYGDRAKVRADRCAKRFGLTQYRERHHDDAIRFGKQRHR